MLLLSNATAGADAAASPGQGNAGFQGRTIQVVGGSVFSVITSPGVGECPSPCPGARCSGSPERSDSSPCIGVGHCFVSRILAPQSDSPPELYGSGGHYFGF